MKNFESLGLKVTDNQVWVLDQTRLPFEENWINPQSPEEMAQIIKDLKVRGAPLIGVAAVLYLASFFEKGKSPKELIEAAMLLRQARPTAINLMNAIDRCILDLSERQLTPSAITKLSEDFCQEDVVLCKKMGVEGAKYIQEGDNILTHCNTGGLATVGIGTALGVIRTAWEQKKKIHVYVDETRPLLQGARLTTWELEKLGIPYTLICDNMAAFLMQQNKISKIFVGSDRVAANGDFANKVGTYSLAVNAKFHNVPFYVVAPATTVDLGCRTGNDIPIEERHHDEVRAGKAPSSAAAYNPSFDVTPRHLVAAHIGCSHLIN